MELQVSCSVCAKISQESILRREAIGDRGNTSGVMSVERCRDHRSRSMPRSYPYAVSDPAEDERFGVHGIPERKE